MFVFRFGNDNYRYHCRLPSFFLSLSYRTFFRFDIQHYMREGFSFTTNLIKIQHPSLRPFDFNFVDECGVRIVFP